ncbi:UPF0223 family protein [Lactococcus termiticola]|uniref:UPF0223 protein NtB2_00910 n=1 Tax=Lactococcus termiticola TaxID=2169526 RepID=A0A2R5HG09_9LACT|nr:UPF0223 family protein [Lactococcus termiticola]GBG96786.1 hypothetical protein NtB2_00910 [Lactococcus termiticola]
MKEHYSYPLDLSWTTDEMSTVVSFFNQVEKFYEDRVQKADFLDSYRAFKTVVPSKMQEKQLGREFESASGYSLYRAVQEVTKSERASVQFSK